MNQKNLVIGGGSIVAIIIIVLIATHSSSNPNNKSMTTMKTSGSTSQTDTSSAKDAVATDQATIQNYAFSPATIKVKVGAMVTWTNQDSVHHNVVADKPSDDAPNGPLIGRGETYSFTFKKPGTYTYHCVPHPYMHGSVVVTN